MEKAYQVLEYTKYSCALNIPSKVVLAAIQDQSDELGMVLFKCHNSITVFELGDKTHLGLAS